MKDLLRESLVGKIIRLFTGDKFLKYNDDLNLCTSFEETIDENGNRIKLVTWYDENDPDNPHNWSNLKKGFIMFQICILTFSIYIGSSIYTPGVFQVMEEFNVGRVVAELPLSLFVLGYGIGPMLFSPLSEDPKFGRNGIYTYTLILFVIMQIPTALVKNIAGLCILRFISGILSSPVLANGVATFGDMIQPINLPYAMPLWAISAVMGPPLGPFLGSVMTQVLDWRWTSWMLMFLTGLSLSLLIFFLPETLAENILYVRSKRLQKLYLSNTIKNSIGKCDYENSITNINNNNNNNNNSNKSISINSTSDISSTTIPESQTNLKFTTEGILDYDKQTTKEIIYNILVKPFIISFKEPGVLSLNSYTALMYAILYLWFETLPIVFLDMYKFNLIQFGMAFLGVIVGGVFGLVMYEYFIVDKLIVPDMKAAFGIPIKKDDQDPEKIIEKTEFKPENLMKIAIFVAPFLPITIFFFAWTATKSIHWIVPIIAFSLYVIPLFMLFQLIFLYLAASYPRYLASVFAGNDLFRSCFAAAFPLFAHPMYVNLGPKNFPVAWGSTILATISLIMVIIPILLYKYGKKLRGNSSYAN